MKGRIHSLESFGTVDGPGVGQQGLAELRQRHLSGGAVEQGNTQFRLHGLDMFGKSGLVDEQPLRSFPVISGFCQNDKFFKIVQIHLISSAMFSLFRFYSETINSISDLMMDEMELFVNPLFPKISL